MEMESMIQSVLKNEFRDRTTLVIAHRIETILEMDKILVLDNGNIQMYGTPSELLNDEDFKQRLK
jgi:ABC-type multidrug transport system fused ATPase/permease subunit